MEPRGPHGGAEERAAGAGERPDHSRWAPGWVGTVSGGCRGGGEGRGIPGAGGAGVGWGGGCTSRVAAWVVSEPPGTRGRRGPWASTRARGHAAAGWCPRGELTLL